MRALSPDANEVCFYHKGKRIGHYRSSDRPKFTDTQSCTKSMVAIALFKARDLGYLKLDDPIIKHLPEWKHYQTEPYKHITIRHLLTHTSGLPGNKLFRPNDKPWSVRGDDQFFNNLVELGQDYNRNFRASLHQVIYTVGKEFDYSNPGTQILAAVLQGALESGRYRGTVEQFITTEILSPLGMTQTTFSMDNGVIKFNGGMRTTAENLVKMGNLILRNGKVGGVEILSSESVKEMVSTPPPSKIEGCLPRYGHLWWRDDTFKTISAEGDLNNLVVVFPDDNIIISRTQHYRTGVSDETMEQRGKELWTRWQNVLGVFKGLPPLPRLT
jgi:CubicO group peptidase (beta-lactamase class C family)